MRVRFSIYGVVQMVGFRYFTLRHARSLSLSGSVRNLPDGSVEVIAEGKKEDLNSLFSLLKEGPPASRVNYVSTEELPADVPLESTFTIR